MQHEIVGVQLGTFEGLYYATGLPIVKESEQNFFAIWQNNIDSFAWIDESTFDLLKKAKTISIFKEKIKGHYDSPLILFVHDSLCSRINKYLLGENYEWQTSDHGKFLISNSGVILDIRAKLTEELISENERVLRGWIKKPTTSKDLLTMLDIARQCGNRTEFALESIIPVLLYFDKTGMPYKIENLYKLRISKIFPNISWEELLQKINELEAKLTH